MLNRASLFVTTLSDIFSASGMDEDVEAKKAKNYNIILAKKCGKCRKCSNIIVSSAATTRLAFLLLV